jgi:anti-sigma B factor antagonist
MAIEPSEDILSLKFDTKYSSRRVLLIEVSGILNTFSSAKLVKMISPDIVENLSLIVFNFENLKFIDSMGVSAMVILYKRVHRAGGKLAVIGAQEGIRTVFEITSIIQKIPIFESIDDAFSMIEEVE